LRRRNSSSRPVSTSSAVSRSLPGGVPQRTHGQTARLRPPTPGDAGPFVGGVTHPRFPGAWKGGAVGGARLTEAGDLGDEVVDHVRNQPGLPARHRLCVCVGGGGVRAHRGKGASGRPSEAWPARAARLRGVRDRKGVCVWCVRTSQKLDSDDCLLAATAKSSSRLCMAAEDIAAEVAAGVTTQPEGEGFGRAHGRALGVGKMGGRGGQASQTRNG
jgi:hypothetical protein